VNSDTRPAPGDAAGPGDSHRHGGEAGHSHLPGADAGIVGVEAIGRLIHPPRVDGGPVVAVAAAGIAINIAAAWVLARANRSSLNVQGAFRHVMTDLYGFIGTVWRGSSSWSPAGPAPTRSRPWSWR
jgi:hypothetical protein